MRNTRSCYSYAELAELAGYESIDKFRCDYSRLDLPFVPFPETRELRAPVFDIATAAKAKAFAQLRQMGIPGKTASEYVRAMRDKPLSVLIDHAERSITIGWPSGRPDDLWMGTQANAVMTECLPACVILQIKVKDLLK